MATKYNQKIFVLNIENNREIVFLAYTTRTRYGFCHTVETCREYLGNKIQTDTKVSYYNRTWERYTYETALIKATEKLGKKYYKSAFIDNNIKRTY